MFKLQKDVRKTEEEKSLSHYGKITMLSGNEISFEVSESEDEEGRVSGVVTEVQKSFADIMNVVKETAESAYDGFQQIEVAVKPDEYEISFGLKLSANAGVIFAQTGGECSFQVTLKWIK